MSVAGPALDPARVAGVQLVPATRAQVDGIAAIEQCSFSDPWPTSAFIEALRNEHVWFVVATDGPKGAVVGYVVAWFVAGEGEIANVAVRPEWRGHGIGARLLDHTILEARERAVERLFLEVRESNLAAQGLYASRGFQQVGRRRGYYRRPNEDALVLSAVLAP
ncbi:MAG TPA: ribosomal protein S18-alanine N-acetyltransferase [Gemmatimonadaceae bacterium]